MRHHSTCPGLSHTPRRALPVPLSRPVSSRYSSVRSSTGNSVHVQPYSGVMFAMQVRCVAESVATPSPKHSTNLSYHALRTQHLRERKRSVHGRYAVAQLAWSNERPRPAARAS